MRTQTKIIVITALMAVFFLLLPLAEAGIVGKDLTEKLQVSIIIAALGFSFSLATEKEGED